MILAGNDIDVVVSDERMPGMTGSQFLTEVRKQVAQHHPHDPLGPGGPRSRGARASTRARCTASCSSPAIPKELQMTILQGLQHKEAA